MLEYIVAAVGIWFVGFFPLAEIYVAIPTAIAVGLDDVSVIVWSVFGNFTPVLLINFLHSVLTRFKRIQQWLENLVSDRVRERVNRYGTWFVLLVTPWTGVWVMAVTAKALGMSSNRFLVTSFISIFIYAIGLLFLIRAGIATLS